MISFHCIAFLIRWAHGVHGLPVSQSMVIVVLVLSSKLVQSSQGHTAALHVLQQGKLAPAPIVAALKIAWCPHGLDGVPAPPLVVQVGFTIYMCVMIQTRAWIELLSLLFKALFATVMQTWL